MSVKCFCRKCHGFLGLIQNDGTFPCADDCPSGKFPNDCPVIADLREQNRGKQRPTNISTNEREGDDYRTAILGDDEPMHLDMRGKRRTFR